MFQVLHTSGLALVVILIIGRDQTSAHFQAAVSRHYFARPKKTKTDSKLPRCLSHSLQLGLILVNTMLVAGVGQAGAVAAVGAVDQVLFIKIDISNMTSNGHHMSRSKGTMPEWGAMAIETTLEVCIWITVLIDEMEKQSGLEVSSQRNRCSCWSRCSPVGQSQQCAISKMQVSDGTHIAVVHVAAVV